MFYCSVNNENKHFVQLQTIETTFHWHVMRKEVFKISSLLRSFLYDRLQFYL